jgi:hypothetical protein
VKKELVPPEEEERLFSALFRFEVANFSFKYRWLMVDMVE